MPSTSPSSHPALARLVTRDPAPRVRRRAHALLLVAEGQPLSRVARLFHTAPHRIRTWRAQFQARGRAGLVDAPRPGRPPKLNTAALGFLAEALRRSPHDYGLVSTVWTVRDLRALLAQRHGVTVAPATVHRA